MKTLFEVKQSMMNIGEQLTKAKAYALDLAGTPGVDPKELAKANEDAATLKMQFETIEIQYNEMDAEQKAKLTQQQQQQVSEDPNQRIIDAKAQLIKATMNHKGNVFSPENERTINQAYAGNMYQALIDDSATGGENFIPKTSGASVISNPTQKNPLRQVSAVTNMPNLELPKVEFTLDDDDFVADGATAKELEAKGSLVTFGRHKFKVFTDISETTLLGTNTNLVATVESNLQSGIAYKEKKVAFATTPKVGEEHMSFYDDSVGIAEVSGDTMFDAIINAVGDLEDVYDSNATVMMRKPDYLAMIKELANGAATLYGKQPEEVIGYPVVFCDMATTPVVGDFSYSHFNYDITALYEQDKNIKTGMNSFVVTAWFDHQIKLTSAFRLATIADPGEPEK